MTQDPLKRLQALEALAESNQREVQEALQDLRQSVRQKVQKLRSGYESQLQNEKAAAELRRKVAADE